MIKLLSPVSFETEISKSRYITGTVAFMGGSSLLCDRFDLVSCHVGSPSSLGAWIVAMSVTIT